MSALRQWAERFDALSQRERMLAALASAFVLGAIVYSLWVVPAEKALKLERQAALDASSEQAGLQAQIATMRAGLALDPDAAGKAELAALQAEIEILGRDLTVAELNLVNPEQMLGLVEDLLSMRSGRRLVSIRALAPEAQRWQPPTPPAENAAGSAAEQTAATAATSGDAQQEVVAAAKVGPVIYRHAVEVEFEGDYAAALDYLRSLEALPQTLRMDRLNVDSRQWPLLRVRLRVSTQSLQEGWIGV